MSLYSGDNCLFQIRYTNTCDLYPYYFEDGWSGLIYLDAHLAETELDLYEEGEEDGEGVFQADLKRGRKEYLLRTGLVTQQRVELLYLLPLFDTIYLTLQTGEVVQVFNLSVSHEYQFDDKQESTVELRFDMGEYLVSEACCTL